MKASTLKLNANDRLFFALNLIFAALALLLLGRADEGYAGVSRSGQLISTALLLGTVPAALFLIRSAGDGSSGLLGWFRTFYPQLMYTLYFMQVIALSRILHEGRAFDAPIARLEVWLFGFRPVMAVFEQVPKFPLLNELFFFGYFAFYLLLAAPWWLIYLRGEEGLARRCLFTVTAALSIFYLWYLIFPVAGPKHYYPELQAVWYTPFEGWLFVPVMKALFSPATTTGAAFPSSHVAIGLLSLLLNFRYSRRAFWWLLPLYLLLCASTIYLYTHYVVDVFAGWIAGGVMYLLVPRLASRVTASEYP
jgi:membrane-associated phospholipid phosphatase